MMAAILNVSRFDNADLNLESPVDENDFESGNDGDAGVWRFDSADEIIQTDALNDPYDSTAWELLFEQTLVAGCDEKLKIEGDINKGEGELLLPTLEIQYTVK